MVGLYALERRIDAWICCRFFFYVCLYTWLVILEKRIHTKGSVERIRERHPFVQRMALPVIISSIA